MPGNPTSCDVRWHSKILPIHLARAVLVHFILDKQPYSTRQSWCVGFQSRSPCNTGLYNGWFGLQLPQADSTVQFSATVQCYNSVLQFRSSYVRGSRFLKQTAPFSSVLQMSATAQEQLCQRQYISSSRQSRSVADAALRVGLA